VFEIPFIFGKRDLGFNYPFKLMTRSNICVDDINSIYYNKIIDVSKVRKRDFRSYEKMVLRSGLYDYGVFVAHNPNSVRGRGSCIFMHIRKPSGAPTVGCTAMSRKELISSLKWLDEQKHPLLIQAPKSQIHKLLPKNLSF
jgi:D-alanyl-D-alanine dipeptidase